MFISLDNHYVNVCDLKHFKDLGNLVFFLLHPLSSKSRRDGLNRDNQGQTRDRQGQNMDKQGQKQNKYEQNRDKQGQNGDMCGQNRDKQG